MTSQTMTPRGHATTTAELLGAAADDREGLAVRQLAATQAIGYALLALGDQVADLTETTAELSGRLADLATISDYVAEIAEAVIARNRRPRRARTALASLLTCGSAR